MNRDTSVMKNLKKYHDLKAKYFILEKENKIYQRLISKQEDEISALFKKCKNKEGEIRYAEDEMRRVTWENEKMKQLIEDRDLWINDLKRTIDNYKDEIKRLNKRRVELANKLEDCQSGE